MNVKEFFDENYEVYENKSPKSDYDFLDFITMGNQKATLLDVGGANGYFVSLVHQSCPNISLTVLDPSKVLLDEISNPEINKVVGKLPDDVPITSKFDYIHVRTVFHHITGNTVGKSKELVKKSIISLKNLLNEDGVMLITEIYYEGYLIPKLPSHLIFYLLKLQNKLNIKIPYEDFILGLDVYFYTRDELIEILEECGLKILDIKSHERSNVLPLKNFGKVSIVVGTH